MYCIDLGLRNDLLNRLNILLNTNGIEITFTPETRLKSMSEI